MENLKNTVRDGYEALAKGLQNGDAGVVRLLGQSFARHRRFSVRNRALIAGQNPLTMAIKTPEAWRRLRRLVRPHARPVGVILRDGEGFQVAWLVPVEDTLPLEGAPEVRAPLLSWGELAATKEGASRAINRAFPSSRLGGAIARAALHYAFGIPSRLDFDGDVEPPKDGDDLFKKTLEAFREAERFIATVQGEEQAAA